MWSVSLWQVMNLLVEDDLMHRTFDPKVLGKRIRQYRLLSGFTQTALAEMLGVAYSVFMLVRLYKREIKTL